MKNEKPTQPNEALTKKDRTYFHGTDSAEFHKFEPSQAAKGNSYWNPLGDGMYVTDQRYFARLFGKNVHQVSIPAGYKYKIINDRLWQIIGESLVNEALKNAGGPKSKWDQTMQFRAEIHRALQDNSPYESLYESVAIVGLHYPELVETYEQALPKVSNAKFKKYDFIVFTSTNDAIGYKDEKGKMNSAQEVVIFNPQLMKTVKEKKLMETTLQRFIDSVITEEVFGEADENPLYNTFIQPFVDVGKTAAYGIERLSAQVQTVVQGFLYGIPTLIVPFLEYDYENFRKEEAEEVEKIKKKYEKTLQSNLDAITSNDAFGLAFLLAPTQVLASQLAVKAPAAAIKVLDILTGGHGIFGGIAKALSGPASVGFHNPGGHPTGAWAGGGGGGGGDYGGGGDDGGMYEAKTPEDPKKQSQEVLKVLKDKKTINLIKKSPVAKQMKKDGVKVIMDHIKRFMALNDYDQMRKAATGDVGFSQIGQKLSQLNQSGQVPKESNPTVTQALVPEIKKAYKDFWLKQLQQLTKQYPEANEELLQGIKELQSLS
jgi:hypothetical protein